MLRELATVPEDWVEVRFGTLALRAPLAVYPQPTCVKLDRRCFLRLREGTLFIHREHPVDSYRGVVTLLAPDPAELSWWRSPWANWQLIGLLRANISGPLAGVVTTRFVAPGAMGVVSDTRRPDLTRYLVRSARPTPRRTAQRRAAA